MTQPLKLCLITLGGTLPVAIVATSRARMVEMLNEVDECSSANASRGWLNGYGSFHEHGTWFDRFAPLGEGVWINRGKEYGEFDITNWEKLT